MTLAKETKQDVTTKSPTRQMWRRSVMVMLLLLGFCFSAIVGKLVILQVVETNAWQTLAVEQQLSDNVISADRGSIYDSNMKLLASSVLVGTVIMSPKNITSDETRKLIADELSAMLGVNRDTLYTQTTKANRQYEIIKRKIEQATVDVLTQWIEKNDLVGVIRIVQDYKRYYTGGNLLSDVIGFTGDDNQGLYGLEAYYEETLAGKPGRIVTAKNGWGDEMPTSLKFEKTIDSQTGNSLVLTIDENVQNITEKYLELAIAETGCTNRGLAVVMNVDTGAVLAMASKGDFDPNEPFTVSNPTTAASLALLAGDEYSAALKAARELQWTNKVITDYYEPGSVFKVFTASTGLEEGVISEDSSFYCTGSMTVGGRHISCHVKTGHGTQNLSKAISNSCNPAFMQIAEKIGPARFFKYFSGFGFTEKTGIDMLSEAAITSSLYHTQDELNVVELATSAFGQTFKITPIQMITGICAVANGGKLMQPYVVQQILDADGNVVKTTEPTVKRQVISESTSQRMATMLAASVNGGGSKNAYVAGYRVAGKTGTSDKTEKKNAQGVSDVWASFSGFAPADDPKIAILVVLDEPQTSIRYGGTISAPVAQKILTDVLPYMGIEPVYTKEEMANLNSTTPNVLNKQVTVAETQIANSALKCRVIGSGATVIKQAPESGATIPKGGMVVLYTDETSISEMATVPNFANMNLSQANTAASNAGINLQMSGLSLESGDVSAATQSVAAGTKVAYGTVVTVNFIYHDKIE